MAVTETQLLADGSNSQPVAAKQSLSFLIVLLSFFLIFYDFIILFHFFDQQIFLRLGKVFSFSAEPLQIS